MRFLVRGKFVNEIVWHYQTSSGAVTKQFIKNHGTILLYAKKKGEHCFNLIYEPWPEATLKKWQKDEEGKIYRVQNKYEKRFYMNPEKAKWQMTFGRLLYLPEQAERIGYPTQKPEALLDRIVPLSQIPET